VELSTFVELRKLLKLETGAKRSERQGYVPFFTKRASLCKSQPVSKQDPFILFFFPFFHSDLLGFA
jgi:hypothetical protein